MTTPSVGPRWDDAAPAVQVENLSIAYRVRGEESTAVRDVSFRLVRGETLALVGESGSGKTTTAHAVIGLLASNGRVVEGSIALGGQDVTSWNQRQWRAFHGRYVALVPQDPHNSLNPVKRIGDSLSEAMRIHRAGDAPTIRRRVLELLERVDIPDPEVRARQYPHQLSGGMKQRVLIASAIALRPALIVADEATSALDVTVQKTILDLIDELRREDGTSVMLVTHDLAVAADRTSEVLVMKAGQVQEQGRTASVLAAPTAAYTRQLVQDAPALADAVRSSEEVHRQLSEPAHADAIISVRNVVKEFAVPGRGGPLRAVDDVSFDVRRGMTHALVGESGSGKSTIARMVMGFERATSGQVTVEDNDMSSLRGAAQREVRRRLQMVYQNPFSSLDPRQPIRSIVEEPLRNYGIGSRGERAQRAREALECVALPATVANRRARELSGGQRQRVAIARALVLDPAVMVLDEAVSALDVTVQAGILDLLAGIQRQFGTTYLFISHDLAVVRQVAQTVTVLRRGMLIESGVTEDIFANPADAYTIALLEAIPGHAVTVASPLGRMP